MNKVVDEIYKKIYEKGEQLSLKDKVKAKWYVTKLVAKNSRLFLKARSLQKKTYKSLCSYCHDKIDSRDVNLSVKEHYELLDNGYFCEKCTPRIREYTDFMVNVKISDVKL